MPAGAVCENPAQRPRHTSKAKPASPFGKLRTSQARWRTGVPESIDYVPHPLFASDLAERDLFGRRTKEIEIPRWTHFPEIPGEIVPAVARRFTLRPADEARLFLRYNYARYRLSKLLAGRHRRKSPTGGKRIRLWHQRAMRARSDLTGANMALVLAMARRTRIVNVEFCELISEGNMALLRSVEKFDVSRGFKFSTYACRAILKSFSRMATKTGRYRKRFPTEFDPQLERGDYEVTKHEIDRRNSVECLREIMVNNLAGLNSLERTVIVERFAIASRGKGRTLAEVGRMVGLTNERIRQIQNLALAKLRGVLDGSHPGGFR